MFYLNAHVLLNSTYCMIRTQYTTEMYVVYSQACTSLVTDPDLDLTVQIVSLCFSGKYIYLACTVYCIVNCAIIQNK